MHRKSKSASDIAQYLLGHSSSPYKWDVVWTNVIVFALLHIGGLYGLYLYFFQTKVSSMILYWFIAIPSGQAVTAGVHRLWCHRTYKATLPLRIILIMLNSLAFQNSAYIWCRDHRLHHKCSETDGDPHNATRGFFFSHMGWLLVKKHPDVIEQGKSIDMSDLDNDPVIMFQKKHHNLMGLIFSVLIPYSMFALNGESFKIAFFVAVNWRYLHSLHATWTVNSLAHMFGNKPYDKAIGPVENPFVSLVTFGEGWHNYHHTFPWDYRTSEVPFFGTDLTTLHITLLEKVGLAYDLRIVPRDIIARRKARTGDNVKAMKDITETCQDVVEKHEKINDVNSLQYNSILDSQKNNKTPIIDTERCLIRNNEKNMKSIEKHEDLNLIFNIEKLM